MSQLETRYAEAFYKKMDKKHTASPLRDLHTLQQWYVDVKDFRLFIHNPFISHYLAEKAIDKLTAKGKLQPLTRNFLCLLVQKKRLALLPQIIEKIFARHNKALGILPTIVTSAHKLSAAQITKIKDALTDKFNKKIQLRTIVDPSVLGGLKIMVGSSLMDATLSAQLQQLQLTLNEV
jgi:F-type H+-transporting ATPase subunit delta